MRFRDPRIWLAMGSCVLVLAVVQNDLERTSPGPVTATHAQVDLEASDACIECHGGRRESMADACGACHGEIAGQIAARDGFHGNLDRDLARDCARCHLEHHGDQVELVSAASFAVAGIPDRDRYDHVALDFELGGRHTELTCAECHPNADAPMLAEGEVRYLGASRDCASCHDDPHEGRIVRACEDCHGQEHPFADLAAFAHTSFVLEGAHVGPSCTDCHPSDGARSVEALAGAGPMPPDRTCVECHPTPHDSIFLDIVAAKLGATAEDSCGRCHDAEHAGFADEAALADSELHAASGFSLAVPHADASCSDCHPRTGGDFVERYPGRDPQQCAVCHDDPHAGEFDGGPFAGQGCLGCHEPHTFLPHAFGLDEHARSAFALTGSHGALDCSACHGDAHAGTPRTFGGAPVRCDACHEDAHGGAFGEIAGTRDGGDCDRCHATTLFQETDHGAFDHALWTGFELDGAHAARDCESCHPRAHSPDELGRTFGRVADAFGEPVDHCETCHADPHAGGFAAGPSVVDEREGCARCHSTGSFRTLHPDAFEHGIFTGFALDGAHERADCAACHGRHEPDSFGRTLGRVTRKFDGPAQSCETCHSDVHGADFARGPESVDGREGCARCHTTESFHDVAPERFDHGLWTGFVLDAAHARTACVACHVPRPTANGVPRRLGRAEGRSCEDCHADPHVGQFAEDGRTDCASCHSGGTDFHMITAFVHDRDSSFALDECHVKLDCSACHIAWPLPRGGEAIRYKPLGTKCGDCHAEKYR